MSQTKTTADIHVRVVRDAADDIDSIRWSATDAPMPGPQDARAMILALWDPEARTSLRIDLWTKDMTVEDMNDFFFQTLLTLADTYRSATNNESIMADIKHFAREFAEKAAKTEQRRA
jgi:gliding motility-associated protein GldC